MIEIQISSLWKFEFALQVKTNSTIHDLKIKICRQTLIPTDNLQLLIVKEQQNLDPLNDCTSISSCQFTQIPEIRYVVGPKNQIKILVKFENGRFFEESFEQSDKIKDLYDQLKYNCLKLNQQDHFQYKLAYEQQINKQFYEVILEQQNHFYDYQFSTYQINIIKALDARENIQIIFKLGEIQQEIQTDRTNTLGELIEQIISKNQKLRNKQFQLLHDGEELEDKDQKLDKLGLKDGDLIVAIQNLQS